MWHERPRLESMPELPCTCSEVVRSDRASTGIDASVVPIESFLWAGHRIAEHDARIGAVWRRGQCTPSQFGLQATCRLHGIVRQLLSLFERSQRPTGHRAPWNLPWRRQR